MTRLLLTTTLALTLGSAALAQETPGPFGGPDGFEGITRAEALERAGARFDAADTDGDGVLDADELREAAQAMRARVEEFRERRGAGPFARFDADSSGGLSRDEFVTMATALAERAGREPGPRRLKRAFSFLDQDDSGALTPQELQRLREMQDGSRPGGPRAR